MGLEGIGVEGTASVGLAPDSFGQVEGAGDEDEVRGWCGRLRGVVRHSRGCGKEVKRG